MFSVNHDDPCSTAAAALSLADGLAPVLAATLSELSGRDASVELARLAVRLEGRRLFEVRTVASLRRRIGKIEEAVQRETAPAEAWVPVRYVDGVEEFEPVIIAARTPHGDALAAIGARVRTLVALIERTRTLLAAEGAIGRRR